MSNQTKEFGEVLKKLQGFILGYNDDIGTYKLVPLAKGGTGEEETEISGIGKEEFMYERDTGENYMRFSLISKQLRYLMGAILTIIEATVDEKKLKPTKDLIKDKFSEKISWIFEQCGLPQEEDQHLYNPPE